MSALWIDPSNGAAGDMLLAALLDSGASLTAVREGLARLRTEPMELSVRQVRRYGFRATLLSVRTSESHADRGLAEVTGLISAAGLAEPVTSFATSVFRRMADAEARVHGVPVDNVRFHEVGALDAIADVVGCSIALDDLDLLEAETRVVGPVAVGSGVVTTAHGVLPVPAPAVLELLTVARAPLFSHSATMELCTPTGAALLAQLATSWGPPPAFTPTAAGIGAGTADPAGHPNILRVLVGVEHAAPADWKSAAFYRVDTTIDDLDPRIWPDLIEELRVVSGADAWCTPAMTHKGRPGQVLSVLAAQARLDLVCRVIFERTTTLGVRISAVERRSLRRDQVNVTIGQSTVRVKRGHLGKRVVTVQPEYGDVLAAARRSGTPVVRLLAELNRAAWPELSSDA